MDPAYQPGSPVVIDEQTSGVSWAAIAAGAATTSAVTLMLVALGAGLGLSAISPWTGSGVTATAFQIGTGIYLVVIAVMASSIGGYLAARLRVKWTGLHTNEVFFRDTAHGLLAWAFATLISAAFLGSATTHIVGGASQVLGGSAYTTTRVDGPADFYVDRLFRTENPASISAGSASGLDAARSEISRLWVAALRQGGDLAAGDRAYIARVVATRTGLSQADAERRVDGVIADAKAATDRARKAAAQLALWLTASLLFGAFAASLAAIEGGQLRDGTWNDRKLVPRSI